MTARRPGAPATAVILLAVGLTLAGCGSDGPLEAVQDMNPFKQEEQKLPGERKAILAGDAPIAATLGGIAKFGPATARGDWPQPGGTAANDPGNVAANTAGTRAWSARAAESGSGGFGFGSSAGVRVSARPIVVGGAVVVYDPAGNVSAHALGNGGRIWRTNVRREGETANVNGGGVAADGGRIFAATAFGELVALDAGTGAKVWTSPLDAPARGAPTAAGGKVFVVTQAGTAMAFDQGTGAKVWSAATGGSGTGLLASASPGVAGDLAVFSTNSGEVVAFDAASGTQRWSATVIGGSRTSAVSGLRDASASPVISNGVVYATGVGGRLIALKAATGESLWQQSIGSVHTPIVSGDAIFMVDLDGRVIALGRAKGDILWATQLPPTDDKGRATWAGPVLAGGRLWLTGAGGAVIAVDAATGAAGAAGALGSDGAIAPIVAGGLLIALGGDGTLVALN